MTDLRTPPVAGCRCATCDPYWPMRDGDALPMRRFITCSRCGNKRCPHATDHRLACTGSNEPGQVGSDYGVPLSEAEKVSRLRFGRIRPRSAA